MDKTFRILLISLFFTVVLFASYAAAKPIQIPTITVGGQNLNNQEQVSTGIQIVFLLTILTLAPAILIMTTSFARIVIVLSFLRQALGTQQMPPNQILIGLSLFLTFFIMHPVWNKINHTALTPYLENKIDHNAALEIAAKPLRKFMFKQTREKDLAVFVKIANKNRPNNRSDISIRELVPAFIISELKTAFQIGFLIYIPFLILDMVVASVLMSMGMMMLPPIVISLPFKLMLFVMIDGWGLIVGSLVKSFI